MQYQNIYLVGLEYGIMKHSYVGLHANNRGRLYQLCLFVKALIPSSNSAREHRMLRFTDLILLMPKME